MKAKPIKFSQLELLEAFDYDTITGALKRKGGEIRFLLTVLDFVRILFLLTRVEPLLLHGLKRLVKKFTVNLPTTDN